MKRFLLFSFLFLGLGFSQSKVFGQYDSLFAKPSNPVDLNGKPDLNGGYLDTLDYHDYKNWAHEKNPNAIPVYPTDLRCTVSRHMYISRSSIVYFSGNYDSDPFIECKTLSLSGNKVSITVNGGVFLLDADMSVEGQGNKIGYFKIFADTVYLDVDGNELNPDASDFDPGLVAETKIYKGTVVIKNNLIVSGNGAFIVDNGILKILGGNIDVEGNSDFAVESGSGVTVEPLVVENDNGTPDNPADDFQSAEGGNVSVSGGGSLRIEENAIFRIVDKPYFDGSVDLRAGGFLSISGTSSDVIVNGQLDIFQSAGVEGLPLFATENNSYYQGVGESFSDYLARIPGLPPLVNIRNEGCQNWAIQVPNPSPPPPFLTPGCNQNDGSLPVVMSRFVANAVSHTVNLQWITAEEENNNYFMVERSYDGMSYSRIGQVSGSGTTSDAQEYGFIDNNPMPGVVYYRLVQTDYDGTSEVFGPVSVVVGFGEQAMTIYPNPLDNGTLKLQILGLRENETALLQVMDLAGRSIYTEELMISRAGGELVELDLASRIKKGVYIINLKQDQNTFTQRLVKL